MAPTDPRLLARIGKAHGLRGEVTVQLHTDDPHGRLVIGTSLPTRAQPGTGVPRELTLAGARSHNGTWLLSFEQIPDRTGAESLRGTLLMLPDDAQVDSDEGEGWYESELVGLTAVTSAGERLGQVAGLEIGSAQDLLVLELDDGVRALVPFVEAIVPEVDLDGGRIVVDPPPGLLELARES